MASISPQHAHVADERSAVITQCSIRHLYTAVPQSPSQIELAKSFERRRCNHHTLDEPLSTLECISAVLDPKSSHTNRHRYVVASQDDAVRRHLREIPGVPLVYVKRSVMVMEPMANSSEGVREGLERGKFRSGLRAKRGTTGSLKRKREDDEGATVDGTTENSTGQRGDVERSVKQKKVRGPKGPNPLSVKKPKSKMVAQDTERGIEREPRTVTEGPETGIQRSEPLDIREGSKDGTEEAASKRKRKRKRKGVGGSGPDTDTAAAAKVEAS